MKGRLFRALPLAVYVRALGTGQVVLGNLAAGEVELRAGDARSKQQPRRSRVSNGAPLQREVAIDAEDGANLKGRRIRAVNRQVRAIERQRSAFRDGKDVACHACESELARITVVGKGNVLAAYADRLREDDITGQLDRRWTARPGNSLM